MRVGRAVWLRDIRIARRIKRSRVYRDAVRLGSLDGDIVRIRDERCPNPAERTMVIASYIYKRELQRRTLGHEID